MQLHQLKTELQQHLSDGLVTIVGSGLSCAEGLPGMGELAAHLHMTVGPSLCDEDQAAWDEIAPLIEEEGLEAALLKRAPSTKVEAAIATCIAELIAERERAVIRDVFSGAKTLRLTRLVPHLRRTKNLITLITTNYDRLVEIAIEEAGLEAGPKRAFWALARVLPHRFTA